MAKSMRGINIDLGKLMARQEKNITVGNTKSNARGDQLGKGGRIVKSADELAREHYNRNDPKAVVHGGIKADADTPEILQTRVEEIAKPMEDDWKEPEETPTESTASKADPVPETIGDEDPWVEDEEGNFVRQSELNQQEQNERVSKPKAKQQHKSNNKKK
jgi:hypothetical protein|tara:strand:- start:1031 stop:1513 length:483 start_codon:yes stop_codon:yes gene_type:complete